MKLFSSSVLPLPVYAARRGYAQRGASASDTSAGAEFFGNHSLWRHATLDPPTDHGIPFGGIAARPAVAVDHARHHEESRVLRRRRVTPPNGFEVVNRHLRIARRIGPAVSENRLSVARRQCRQGNRTRVLASGTSPLRVAAADRSQPMLKFLQWPTISNESSRYGTPSLPNGEFPSEM